MTETKEQLKQLSEKFQDIKTKMDTRFYMELWKEMGLKNPLEIVKEFIMEKGLKLYGGQALHEHLRKLGDGFYESWEFPDYDVFSPDAWNHAKELADRLHDMGYQFVEAKASVLNDEVHQTYKVGCDMFFILDLTQVGCLPDELENGKCDFCGKSKDGKCFSLFNYIPAVDVLKYNPAKDKNPKEYTETYDYINKTGLEQKKLLMCSSDYLKISMYKEMTQPLQQPERLPKVGTRLQTFLKHFKFDHSVCKNKDFNREVNESLKPVLKSVAAYIKKNKLINYGATAYNLFVRGNSKNLGQINVPDYQAYANDSKQHANNLLKILQRKFKNMTFGVQEKIMYWKKTDTHSYTVHVTFNKIRHNYIAVFTDYENCLPYVQYNGVRYVTIDRMKFLLYKSVVLSDVMDLLEEHKVNYECMLSNLIKLEEDANKKKKRGSNKFKRIIATCEGTEINKIYLNKIKQWAEKKNTLKNTTYIIDAPKKNYVTKITPRPSEKLTLPYKPEEMTLKKTKKVGRNQKIYEILNNDNDNYNNKKRETYVIKN
jgi:hypothetical protein